jgi:putative FmdB family regulatory protein
MPTYTFQCSKCKKSFESFLSVPSYENKDFPNCPFCLNKRVARNFAADMKSINGFMVGQTLGSVADKNTSKMSDEAKKEQWLQDHDYLFGEPELELPAGMERLRDKEEMVKNMALGNKKEKTKRKPNKKKRKSK